MPDTPLSESDAPASPLAAACEIANRYCDDDDAVSIVQDLERAGLLPARYERVRGITWCHSHADLLGECDLADPAKCKPVPLYRRVTEDEEG